MRMCGGRYGAGQGGAAVGGVGWGGAAPGYNSRCEVRGMRVKLPRWRWRRAVRCVFNKLLCSPALVTCRV